jgi:hypothetical protein
VRAVDLLRRNAWLAVLAIFAVAVLLRFFIPTNSDVSWCITAAEKMLTGARLYADVIEVNPPATIYLYLPAVAFAKMFSLRPEWVVNGFVFLLAGCSLWFSGWLLTSGHALKRTHIAGAAAGMMFVLLVLPGRAFAEREHFALIFSLPAISVFVLLAAGKRPGWAVEIAAGIGAGLMAIIKPHLALGMMFAALAAAVTAKSWRPLFALQNWIAAALCAAYALWVWLEFPVFFAQILPLATEVYVPVKESLLRLLFQNGLIFWLAGFPIVYRMKGAKIFQPLFAISLAASIGFAAAYLWQAKGWPYQLYPALALSMMVLIAALLDSLHEKKRDLRASALLVAVVAACGLAWMMMARDVSGLAAPIRAMNPHPKMIALSGNLGVGHPLVRDVNGRWAGRMPSLWTTIYASILLSENRLDPESRVRVAAFARRDREIFAEDVMRERPDIILLDRSGRFDWLAWANGNPGLAEALKAYRPRGTFDEVTILSRDTP